MGAIDDEILRRLESIDRRFESQNLINLDSRAELVKINTNYGSLNNNINKLISVVLGLIGANTALRLIGSPLWLDIIVYFNAIALGFVIIESVRRRLLFRFVAGMALLLCVILILENVDMTIPYFDVEAASLFSLCSISLAFYMWRGRH